MSNVTLKELADLSLNYDPENCGWAVQQLIIEHLPPTYKKLLDAMPKRGPVTASKIAEKLNMATWRAEEILEKLEDLGLAERNVPKAGKPIVRRRV